MAFQQGLALGRIIRQPRMISMISIHSAVALLTLGHYAEARERLQEGLAVARETQDRWLVGAALAHLGMVMLAQGDHAGARTALLEAVALAQDTGNGWDRAWWEVSLGDVYLAERDAGQAEVRYRLGMQLALEANALPVALTALAGFARLRALAGDRDGALEVARHVCSTRQARATRGLGLRRSSGCSIRTAKTSPLPHLPATSRKRCTKSSAAARVLDSSRRSACEGPGKGPGLVKRGGVAHVSATCTTFCIGSTDPGRTRIP